MRFEIRSHSGIRPSPVRAVRCPVKSGNERDPRPYLPADLCGDAGHNTGTAIDKIEEGEGHGSENLDLLVFAEVSMPRIPWATEVEDILHLGHTRAAMSVTIGFDSERRRQSSNALAVRIVGCNSPT